MRTPLRLLLSLLAMAMVVAACGSDDRGDDTSAAAGDGDGAFPITIEHIYGETVIESKPERIATVAWANHEVPLALGVVPVGMAKATWGDDDDDGVLPWVTDRLEELGAEVPVLFDETDGFDVEAVADTDPDLILATYSGITEEEYETLSKIAPVVAFPEVAWGTSVQDMILISSQAMGMADEGAAFLEDMQAEVQSTYDAYPQLADKSIVFSYVDPADTSEIGFYTTHDTRPGFMHELGMGVPAIVAERSAATEAFYDTVSSEQADLFDDADIFVIYGEGHDETLAALRGDPLIGTIPAIERGSVAVLENSTPLAASANPSPLSIGWGLDEYLALLAAAADLV